MRKIVLLLLVMMLATVTNLYALPVSLGFENTVSGSDMAGMGVTVEYHDGTTNTQQWQAGQGNNGGAQNGNLWSLDFNGSDTWFSNNMDDQYFPNDPDKLATWEFNTTEAVSSITINAWHAGVFFDIYAIWDEFGDETGFPNTNITEDGWWDGNSTHSADTSGFNGYSWEFSNPFGNTLGAGDLFGILTINFDNPNTDWTEVLTGPFNFGVDTDQVVLVSNIPEPATMVLFGTGIFGLIGVSRRRKQ